MPTLNVRFDSALGQSKGQETRLDGASSVKHSHGLAPCLPHWGGFSSSIQKLILGGSNCSYGTTPSLLWRGYIDLQLYTTWDTIIVQDISVYIR